MVITSLARAREEESMSQAAWLKERWNRDRGPLPTWPLEEMTSVMKRCLGRLNHQRLQDVSGPATVIGVGSRDHDPQRHRPGVAGRVEGRGPRARSTGDGLVCSPPVLTAARSRRGGPDPR